MANPERRRLTRGDVVETAIEIIDADGVPACTMRAVATRLGVEAMSLYWHVENKQALLDAVVARVVDTAHADMIHDGTGDWQEVLRGAARTIRRMLHAHPNAVGLIAGRSGLAFSHQEEHLERTLAVVEEAGFSRVDAVHIVRSVIRVAFGVTMAEIGADRPEDPAGASRVRVPPALRVDPEVLFDATIEAMLVGIETRGGLVIAAADA